MTSAGAGRAGFPRLVSPVAVALLAAGAIGLLAVHDPRVPGSYGICPSVALFGVACPGCGSLRAIGALTRGEVVEAWAYNPLALLAVVGLVIGWCAWVLRLWRDQPRRSVPPAWLLYTLAGLVVGYGVARNVPALSPYLGPLAVP